MQTHLSIAENNDLVGVVKRRQTMGDDQRTPSLGLCRGTGIRRLLLRRVETDATYQIVQRLLHESLVLSIECRCSLSVTDEESVTLPPPICSSAHLIKNEN